MKTICEAREYAAKRINHCICGCGREILSGEEMVKLIVPGQSAGVAVSMECWNSNFAEAKWSITSNDTNDSSNNCITHKIRVYDVAKEDVVWLHRMAYTQRGESNQYERIYRNAQSAGVVVKKLIKAGYPVKVEINGHWYDVTGDVKAYDLLTKEVRNRVKL